MERGSLAFKKSDVVRAIKSVQSAGLDVVKTEIHPDGRIILYHQLEPIPEEFEESFEDWSRRTELEASVNARVYAKFEAERQPTSQDLLRERLAAKRREMQDEAKSRLEGKRREREQAKSQLPDVCTPKILADLWGCSAKHVRRLAQTGELKSFVIGKRMIRIKKEEAEAFQARHGTAIIESEAVAPEPATGPAPKRPRAKRLDIGPNASLRAFKAQRR